MTFYFLMILLCHEFIYIDNYRFMDRMYTSKAPQGTSFGYSQGNPMGTATQYPTKKGMYAPKNTGGYVAKSKLNHSSTTSVRSKSTRSHVMKRRPTKRFNEEIDNVSRQSKASFHPARPSVKNYRPQVNQSAEIEKPTIIDHKRSMNKAYDQEHQAEQKERNYEDAELEREGTYEDIKNPEANGDEAKGQEDQELHDEIDSLYYGSSYSGRSGASGVSKRSQLTSATYISKLEKELQEERRAREKLSVELEEIKKISSEISSHLGLKPMEYNNN
jgi:hypothetical protein